MLLGTDVVDASGIDLVNASGIDLVDASGIDLVDASGIDLVVSECHSVTALAAISCLHFDCCSRRRITLHVADSSRT